MLLDGAVVKTVFALRGKEERVAALVPLLVPHCDMEKEDSETRLRQQTLRIRVKKVLLNGQPFVTMLSSDSIYTLLTNHGNLVGPDNVARILNEVPRFAKLLFLGCDFSHFSHNSFDGDVVTWAFRKCTSGASRVADTWSLLRQMHPRYNPFTDVLTREHDIGFSMCNTNLLRLDIAYFLRRKQSSFEMARRLDTQLRMLLALDMEFVDEDEERIVLAVEEVNVYGITVRRPWLSALGGVPELVRRMRGFYAHDFHFCEERAIHHLTEKLRVASASLLQASARASMRRKKQKVL